MDKFGLIQIESLPSSGTGSPGRERGLCNLRWQRRYVLPEPHQQGSCLSKGARGSTWAPKERFTDGMQFPVFVHSALRQGRSLPSPLGAERRSCARLTSFGGRFLHGATLLRPFARSSQRRGSCIQASVPRKVQVSIPTPAAVTSANYRTRPSLRLVRRSKNAYVLLVGFVVSRESEVEIFANNPRSWIYHKWLRGVPRKLRPVPLADDRFTYWGINEHMRSVPWSNVFNRNPTELIPVGTYYWFPLVGRIYCFRQRWEPGGYCLAAGDKSHLARVTHRLHQPHPSVRG
ncbi:hypothetical protein QFZ23_003642 [Arthrobacter globiformis]|nr:hypothetical protein [Arthrobacter globiformis]